MDSAARNTIAAQRFEEELLKLLSRQARRVPIPVFICTCMIAGLAWPYASRFFIVAWLLVVAIVLVVRWRVLGGLSDDRTRSLEQRVRIAICLSAINGCVHGASLLFLLYLPLFESAVHSMILIGMSAGAVVTTAGNRYVFITYAFPTLVPLAGMWAFSTNFIGTGWIHWIMAAMILVLAYILDAVTRDMGRVLRESFDIRAEHAALTVELRQALTATEAASQAKTRFLASASHDLRQPLQALALFAATLAMRPLDERSRHIATHINTALSDLTQELDALLDISKLDAGIVVPEPQTVDLRLLVQRIADNFSPVAEQKGLTLTYEPRAAVSVFTDRKLLDRVLRNVIENAIKYTDAGSVRIVVERRDVQAQVTISDTGCGIPENERERVFEEFYQANNPERDRKRGLGLGLAIVKRLVNLLDVTLELQSSSTLGTTFVLTMHALPEGTLTAASSPNTPWDFQGLNVLVVDDEEPIRTGMQLLLEQLGCNVRLAGSSADALGFAKSDPIDVVIADFRLRGTDNGLDSIRQIRELTARMPAILMTGETAPERLREAQGAEVDVLHKPVTAKTLALALHNARNNHTRSTAV